MNPLPASAFSLQRPIPRRVLNFWAAALLCAGGCACPRRAAETTHTLEYFAERDDGLLERETWRDTEGGGGIFLLADPNVQAMSALHTNQSALGGGSAFSAGSMIILVDTNTDKIIGATGTALGNVIGASLKAAAK